MNQPNDSRYFCTNLINVEKEAVACRHFLLPKATRYTRRRICTVLVSFGGLTRLHFPCTANLLPGDVYHVDAIVEEGLLNVTAWSSEYTVSLRVEAGDIVEEQMGRLATV